VLARLEVPAAWRVLVVQDDTARGLHGSAEVQALQQLPPFGRERAADLCHQVLMKMLPSLAEARFEPFAQAVSDVQRSIGDYFAPAQSGSMYTSPAVARLMQWIAASGLPAGVGQSSWGPTAFAFVASSADGQRLLDQARAAGVLEPRLQCHLVAARNRGATLESHPLRAA
jgi:beta-RFAP synthase